MKVGVEPASTDGSTTTEQHYLSPFGLTSLSHKNKFET